MGAIEDIDKLVTELCKNAEFGFLSTDINGKHVELIVIAKAHRIEVTNPGVPLVDVMRIIDNPPRSRNEKLASLMRRMGMCEELGRGWQHLEINKRSVG